MKIINTIPQMQKVAAAMKKKGKSVGLVPTMGALHEGHASLIRRARKENDSVVVSIFVNPKQFAPKEDFRRYPRQLKQDIALCRKSGVDFIFLPKNHEMYQPDFKTFVYVDKLSDTLCGVTRPGHFRGVTTVVTKLFNIVRPDTAYFGQKDAQQFIIIRQMANDLNMPVKIKMLPTIRENNGLALSSRNVYLNEKQRMEALVLSQALTTACNLIKNGVRDPGKIINKMRALISRKHAAKIDYAAIVDSASLMPAKRIKENCLIALAVWIGKTRLIDNIFIGSKCLKN